MLGTIANTAAIIVGSLIGVVFKKGIPEKYNQTIMDVMSLAVILIGLKSAFKSDALLVIILCLIIGTLIGESLDLEGRLENVGHWLEIKFTKSGQGIAKGFVTASLLYCVGAMAILGSLESGLTGNHQILFAKAVLDGIISVVLAASLGLGVMLAAVSVFLYQGIITLCAVFLEKVLAPEVIAQMSSVGGLLIVGLGINMLEIKKLKVGNMLPAIFLPVFYFIAKQLF